MTRLVTTGYETGDIAEAGTSTIGTNATLTVVSSTPTPRSPGAYCLKALSTASSTGITNKGFNLGSAKPEIWVRFAHFVHIVGTLGVLPIARWVDSAATTQLRLDYQISTGLLLLNRGDGTTLLGTASLSYPQDTWHGIEWRVQITSVTVGVSEVWLDGTRVINYSGDVVQTANANIQTLQLGIMSSLSSGVGGTYSAYDDIAINDVAGSINNGQINDGRVVLLKPTGAGSTTGLTRGGTDTGANWSQTSELPPSLTQYVYSATAATRDTYALDNVPAGSWTVNACEVLAYGQNNDAGAGALGLTVKSGSTTNEGTAQNLATTAAYFRQLYETDPNTSAAWTEAAVNALEAGVTVR